MEYCAKVMEYFSKVDTLYFSPSALLRSAGADVEEEHAEEDKGEVKGLGLEVALVEEPGAEEETDDDGAATDHRDDADHGIGQGEGVEVHEVGRGEEEGYADDGPRPVEGCGLLMLGPPEQQEHHKHHEALVDVVPRLDEHAVEPYPALADGRHEVLVVKAADGSEGCSADNHVDPVVVAEVDALLLA